ncbi:MAG TPA: DUF2877 domain-containing protein [Hyphomicrobiaceae bacterium]|nr:DUF2877 domain-containing protein [Hyphomicrobiaceae bacterium]
MPTFRVVRIGSAARDMLAQSVGTEADVHAVFERSFYLLTEHGLVCVGARAIGNGPINVLIDAVPERGFEHAGIFREAKAQITEHGIAFGDDVLIEKGTDVPVWEPAGWPLPAEGWERALTRLREVIAAGAPKEGLARHVLDPRRAVTMVEQSAQMPVGEILKMLPEVLRSREVPVALSGALTLLVGLGPGLTPSGDDVLAGMALTLTAIAQTKVRDAIWEAVGPELEMLTVPVSAMHLALAFDGMGAEALHDAIATVLSGRVELVEAAVARVAEIGATSGWDALAGVLMTLEAVRDRRVV